MYRVLSIHQLSVMYLFSVLFICLFVCLFIFCHSSDVPLIKVPSVMRVSLPTHPRASDDCSEHASHITSSGLGLQKGLVKMYWKVGEARQRWAEAGRGWFIRHSVRHYRSYIRQLRSQYKRQSYLDDTITVFRSSQLTKPKTLLRLLRRLVIVNLEFRV